jgi:hypothetical protein
MMDSAVRKIRAAREVEEYLGPATVVEALPHRMVVSLPGGATACAELAFAMPYEPAVDDELLVIGKGGAYYAIGVLRGTGRTAFSIQGDVELRSVGGKLTLAADRGVEVRAPEVDVYTTALRMVARDVTQRFESLCQRVSSLLRVHAGESQTLVDQGAVTQAKRAAILTEEAVSINGREIHLG